MDTQRVTYEINWTPAEDAAREDGHGEAGAYRMVQAGICGPWGINSPADSRRDAEVAALALGLMRSGEWRIAANGFHYCDAVKIDV